MTDRKKQQLLNYLIATVWLINGLFCKVLNFVPRHQEIVAQILGNNNARLFTFLIGLSEIIMTIWIISQKWTRINAIIQILVITTMNMLEFLLVPNLLLWGKANTIFAFLFILIIYYKEFRLKKNVAL
jgi:Ca2+/Na+ antiporter